MDDYISRVMAIARLTKVEVTNKLATMTDAKREIAEMPAADVVPVVHGRWIEDHDYLKCPECGVMVKWDFTFFDIGNWNYCPNCGAKMENDEDGGADNAKSV